MRTEAGSPVDPKIVSLVRRAVKSAMGSNVSAIRVEGEPDFDDGAEMLSIRIEYPAGATLDPSKAARLPHTIGRLLREAGERRFPHIRHIEAG